MSFQVLRSPTTVADDNDIDIGGAIICWNGCVVGPLETDRLAVSAPRSSKRKNRMSRNCKRFTTCLISEVCWRNRHHNRIGKTYVEMTDNLLTDTGNLNKRSQMSLQLYLEWQPSQNVCLCLFWQWQSNRNFITGLYFVTSWN